MSFNKKIISLIKTTQEAWNNNNCEAFENLFEESILATVAPVTIGLVSIESAQLKDKKEIIEFLKNLRKRIPLKYVAEYDTKNLSKHIHYSKFFYQIGLRAHFECVISEYGKYKEFHIQKYENAKAGKITSLQIIKNVLKYKVTSLLGKKDNLK